MTLKLTVGEDMGGYWLEVDTAQQTTHVGATEAELRRLMIDLAHLVGSGDRGDAEAKIDRLQNRVEGYEDWTDRLQEDRDDHKAKRRSAEAALLEDVDGVIQLDEDEWMWGCACGGRGVARFESEDEAREAYEKHHERHSEHADEEEAVEA